MIKTFTPARRSDSLFTLLLFCLFMVLALILVVVISGLYQRTAAAAAGDYQLRTAMNYMANKVRRAPEGTVRTALIDGRQVLALESDEGYSTLIYWEDGKLRELVSASDDDQPLWSAGTVIVELKAFAVFREGGLLCLRCTTDQETALLKLALAPGGGS
jgi:hypothetical protein